MLTSVRRICSILRFIIFTRMMWWWLNLTRYVRDSQRTTTTASAPFPPGSPFRQCLSASVFLFSVDTEELQAIIQFVTSAGFPLMPAEVFFYICVFADRSSIRCFYVAGNACFEAICRFNTICFQAENVVSL